MDRRENRGMVLRVLWVQIFRFLKLTTFRTHARRFLLPRLSFGTIVESFEHRGIKLMNWLPRSKLVAKLAVFFLHAYVFGQIVEKL